MAAPAKVMHRSTPVVCEIAMMAATADHSIVDAVIIFILGGSKAFALSIYCSSFKLNLNYRVSRL